MKRSISEKIRLQHILESINDILLFTKDIDYESYISDYKLRLEMRLFLSKILHNKIQESQLATIRTRSI